MIGESTVKAIKTWAVAAVRYTAGIVNRTAEELKAMDRKTRKLMVLNGALHPRADVEKLWESGRGRKRLDISGG